MAKKEKQVLVSSVDRRYSKALYGALASKNDRQEAATLLLALARVIDQQPHLKTFLASPVADRKAKLETIRAGLGDSLKTNPHLHAFFQILTEKNRLDRLSPISQAFLEICEKGEQIKKLIVEAAFKPDADRLKDMESALRKAFQLDLSTAILVDFKENKEILGGFIVHFEGKTIDLSLASKFKSLMAQMGAS